MINAMLCKKKANGMLQKARLCTTVNVGISPMLQSMFDELPSVFEPMRCARSSAVHNAECEHSARAHSCLLGRLAGAEQQDPAGSAAAATGPSHCSTQTAAGSGKLSKWLSCL